MDKTNMFHSEFSLSKQVSDCQPTRQECNPQTSSCARPWENWLGPTRASPDAPLQPKAGLLGICFVSLEVLPQTPVLECGSHDEQHACMPDISYSAIEFPGQVTWWRWMPSRWLTPTAGHLRHESCRPYVELAPAIACEMPHGLHLD